VYLDRLLCACSRQPARTVTRRASMKRSKLSPAIETPPHRCVPPNKQNFFFLLLLFLFFKKSAFQKYKILKSERKKSKSLRRSPVQAAIPWRFADTWAHQARRASHYGHTIRVHAPRRAHAQTLVGVITPIVTSSRHAERRPPCPSPEPRGNKLAPCSLSPPSL
jgi:hypothetical protein